MGRNKSLQSPEGVEVLSCLLHDCAGVRGPCLVLSDVDPKEPYPLLLLFPVVQEHLVDLAD
jgi:hypothetical protein